MTTDKKYFRRDELAFKVALRLKFDSKRVVKLKWITRKVDRIVILALDL